MKLVHSADVHLDSPLRGLDAYEGAPSEALRAATRQALDNLVSLCIDEQASLLVLAGDLYDGDWPDFNTGLYFHSQMARLDTAGVRVALISGNHDAASRITKRLPSPRNVMRFSAKKAETFLLEDLGVALHGQSFGQREVTENLASRYPAPIPGCLNIGVLHTALDGRVGHDTYAPCSPADLAARGYDYWALGHVHQREIVSRDPWIVYPGCLQGRSVRELGAKGCWVVSVDEGRIEQVEFREVGVLRWAVITVDATGLEREDALLPRIADSLRRAIEEADGRRLAARVRIVGKTGLHETWIRDQRQHRARVRALGIEAGHGEIWIEKVVLETSPLAPDPVGARRDDGMGELLGAVGDILLDPNARRDLASELEPLLNKLPSEVLADGQLLDPREPEQLERLVKRAEALLLARLGATEVSP